MQKNTKLPSLKGIKNLNTTVLLKKQWYDLNFIFNQNDNTKKALSYPSKLLKAPRTSYSTKKPPEKNPKPKKKKFVRPGTEFREKIIRIFKANEDESDVVQAIRNYYYIRHGVDTLLIAPLSKKMIDKIISLMPKRLTHHDHIVSGMVDDLRIEYFEVMKKSIIQYALSEGGPKVKIKKRDKESYKNKLVYHENRYQLYKSLYPINKCLSLVNDLWHSKFAATSFVNVDTLVQEESYDIRDFVAIIVRQIEESKQFLATNWYNALQELIMKKVKKHLFQTKVSRIKAKKFFRLLAITMENNLQDVCERSLIAYTDFICRMENLNQTFKLSIGLGDSETLMFTPSFIKIQEELLQINELILRTVDKFERIENYFVEDLQCTAKYLKPNISKEIVQRCKEKILFVLGENRVQPELRIQDFDLYLSLMNGEDAEKIEAFVNGAPAFEEYCERINYFKKLQYEIAQNISGVIITGNYEFHREGLIETLEELAKFLQNELISHLTGVQQREITSVAQAYENISKNILTVPRNTNELMHLRSYAEEMETVKIPQMEKRLKANMEQLLWLFDYKIFTPLEIKQNSLSFQWYLKMASVFESHKEIIRVKTLEYQDALKRKIEMFKRELELYWEQVKEYEHWGEIKNLAKYKKKASMLHAKLNVALDRIVEINEEEVSFEWEKSQFPLQEQTNGKLTPHKKLFDAGQNFMDQYDLWMHTQVGIHEPAVIEKEIVQVLQIISELEVVFAEKPETLKLTLDIKTVVDEFKTHLPIIQTLGNCGMRDRHWEQVSEIIGFPIKVSVELTLEKVIEYGLDDYIAKFEVISMSATKENGLEKAMANMISEWTAMCFLLDPYCDTATYILAAVDDIQVLLDDHIIKTQTMKNSPYIKPFAKEIDEWESKLILLQEILDDWLNVQRTWMFLEPILSSPDIQIQMPEEGRRFSSVDKIWKDLMKQVQVDTQVMVVIEIDKMSERLKKAYSLLVAIQKGLNAYLDKKRVHFPRFFFISNDELLEILSETKDALKIQIYLNKCFAGIAHLNFSETFSVESIQSLEMETIELCNTVITANARGQVEKWLLELETEMQNTMRNSLKNTMADAQKEWSTFLENILQYPGQSLHCCFSILWTEKVKELISLKSEFNEFLTTEETLFKALLSKSKDENLQMKDKTLLNNLLILKLYQISVGKQLKHANVSSLDNFEWLAQLRHEYQEEDNLTVHSITSSLEYGFEYLGNAKRLVLTPQTERCYRTLFLALNYQLGGHISGPAGAGKTELIKDFAKCLAKFLVVFNCSNDTPKAVLGSFFKGMAGSGSWCCLDEVDRLDYQTMSLIAQQLLTIQKKVKAKALEINLEEFTLKLKSNCAIFITSNPSATQSKISNNLKLRFRPISIAVPDIQLILEVNLKALGFANSEKIAMKLTRFYEILWDRLSPQNFYEFGLRNLLAIIAEASQRKGAAVELKIELIAEELAEFHRPKLFENDLEIFNDLLQHMFGPVGQTGNDQEESLKLLSDICQRRNIVCSPYIVKKTMEIKSLLEKNIPVIVLGEPYSGKTVCICLVKELLSEEAKVKNPETKTSSRTLNPKAVTLSQLFGFLDQESSEWKDGVISQTLRRFNRQTDHLKFLVLDGPLDSLWLNKFNSILDESHTLSLSSGEIIKVPRDVKIIFETSDLCHASPAIISRCGVVFTSAIELGWMVVFDQWKVTRVTFLHESSVQLIGQMVQRFCPILFWLLRSGFVTELSTTTDSSLLQSMLNLFECFLDDYQDEKYVSTLSDFDIRAQLEGTFFFSCVWGLGGALNVESRTVFSEIFHGLLEKKFPEVLMDKFGVTKEIQVPNLVKPYIFPIPKQNTVFEYRYVKEGKGKWKLWTEELNSAPAIPRDIAANEIIITIPENLRIYHLMDLLIKHSKHFMIVGPTGTGKTVYTQNYLSKRLDRGVFLSQTLNFCGLTQAGEVQETIMSKLEKRRKNVFGPSMGKKCVYFIDDVSIPKRESSGSQPPIELLRLWLDHSIWYEQKDLQPINLEDLQFICSMTSENHSNYISPRFKRHFHLLAIDEFQDETVKTIFSKIILWHLDTRGFSKEFDPCIQEIVNSTLTISKMIRQRLFPTPATMQYVFNIRDFSRVVSGVLLSVPEATEDLNSMRRMWFHEVLRTYSDRLMEQSDKDWLLENMVQIAEENMKLPIRELCDKYFETKDQSVLESNLGKMMFCDFTNPKADTRNYLEVQDFDELVNVVDSYLVEYNNMKKPINLIFFKYTIEHLSRICRIIKQSRNHAIILGHNGRGRQSLAKLAAHIVDREMFQIDITQSYNLPDWNTDMKNILRKISSNELHAVFLLTDHQIKYDEFLKDIHYLLLSGEIPNLFQGEDKADIIEKMREIDKNNDKNVQTDGTPLALYNYFVRVIREQLHVVLCMSPDNKNFRRWLKHFPSIIKSCTIDWFEEWPQEAFVGVGQRFLSNVGIGEINPMDLIDLSINMHKSSQSLAREYFVRLGRPCLITPFSYLEFCRVYKKLFNDRMMQLKLKETRHQKSIKQIENAADQIIRLQNRLQELEPKLKSTAEALAEQTIKVQEHSEVVVIERDKLNQFDAVVGNQTTELKKVQAEIDEKLEPHISDLDATLVTLRSISPSEFLIVKNLKSPPAPIKILLECICILKDIRPDRTQAGTDDYWNPSKRLVTDLKFLENLWIINKDEIPMPVIEILTAKLLRNETLDYEKIKNFSPAFEALLNWTLAILRYHDVIVQLSEDLQARDQALNLLNENTQILNEMTQKMAALDNASAENQRDLDEQQDYHNALTNEFDNCTIVLERANNLISGIGNETDRWKANISTIGLQLKNHIGDILLASGMITYLGPFTQDFRNSLLAEWKVKCEEKQIDCTKDFSLQKVLYEFDDQKLDIPTDSYFLESTLIVQHSQRWPLIIDPHSVAANWIKLMEKRNRLCVIRLNEPDSYRILENSIQFGLPVLLEKLKEDFDPSMEAVLQKQLFKQDGQDCVKLKDSMVEYSENFRLYITTELDNPKYTPEIAMVVNIVNFTMTKDGLDNRFLSLTIARERPDLEAEKKQLNGQFNNQDKQLNDIERNVLDILSLDVSVLENERDVESLNSYYVTKLEIQEKQTVIMSTRNHIDNQRFAYLPIAKHATELFLITDRLGKINTMYQFSLDWCGSIYMISIDNSEKFDNIGTRINEIKNHFTSSLFENICQGLLEEDKGLLAFLLALNASEVNEEQFMDFLKLPALKDKDNQMMLEEGNEILKAHKSHLDLNADWSSFFNTPTPYADPSLATFSAFERLMIIKILRQDRLQSAVVAFVQEILGLKFIEGGHFDLIKCFEDSTNLTPLLFIMTTETDNPVARILQLANAIKFDHEKVFIHSISDSGAQDLIKFIEKNLKLPHWIVIENIHGSLAGLKALATFMEQFTADNANPDFRLWISTRPLDGFSKSLLQRSVKMIDAHKDGLRGLVKRALTSEFPCKTKLIEASPQKALLQSFIPALCLFHGVVQKRHKFNPRGWTLEYEFNESDLQLSFNVLYDTLNVPPNESQVESVIYLIGKAIYGGQMCDPIDVKILGELVREFLDIQTIESKKTKSIIDGLSMQTDANILGLHRELAVDVNYKQMDGNLKKLLNIQDRKDLVQVEALDDYQVALRAIEEITAILPKPLDKKLVAEKFNPKETILKNILFEEYRLYDQLHQLIGDQLEDLKQHLMGTGNILLELDDDLSEIVANRIPNKWRTVAYLSSTDLKIFTSNFAERFKFLENLLKENDKDFWISGLYRLPTYLIGLLQEYSKEKKIPLENLTLELSFADGDKTFTGLYLDLWDKETKQITERSSSSSDGKPVHDRPLGPFKIIVSEDVDPHVKGRLSCPLYSTSVRSGDLSRTGRNPNLIGRFYVDFDKEFKEDHWIKRGVAMSCQRI